MYERACAACGSVRTLLVVWGGGSHVFGGRARRLLAEGSVSMRFLSSMSRLSWARAFFTRSTGSALKRHFRRGMSSHTHSLDQRKGGIFTTLELTELRG